MFLFTLSTKKGTYQTQNQHTKGVNQHSNYATQVQQQWRESPTVTSTWHVCKYKVHKLHQSYRGTQHNFHSNIKNLAYLLKLE